jgi:hypothetical protein
LVYHCGSAACGQTQSSVVIIDAALSISFAQDTLLGMMLLLKRA